MTFISVPTRVEKRRALSFPCLLGRLTSELETLSNPGMSSSSSPELSPLDILDDRSAPTDRDTLAVCTTHHAATNDQILPERLVSQSEKSDIGKKHRPARQPYRTAKVLDRIIMSRRCRKFVTTCA